MTLLGVFGSASFAVQQHSFPEESSTEPVLAEDTLDVWLEATPLHNKNAPTVIASADPAEPLVLESGRWLICVGAAGLRPSTLGTECLPLPGNGEPPRLPALAPGTEITGTVLVGGRPVPDAHISVFPAGLASRRSITLPLAWDPQEEALLRSVGTQADGIFRTPPLAAGDYQLEIVLPGGRRLPTEPFSLPAAATLLPRGQDPATTQAVWDLAELAFDAGMRVEVLVMDAAGTPVPGARVGGSQGESPEERVLFATESGEDGVAVLTGLDPTTPVHLVCRAEGYVRMSGTFEVPPASVPCTLEAVAAAEGSVLDEDDEPVPAAVLTLLSGGEPAGAPEKTEEDGRFTFDNLAAGSYELEASAPGLRVATRTFTVEPGETALLEPIVLRRGERITGVVVVAATQEPVAGAQITVTRPPGGDRTTTDGEGFFELQADPDRPPTVEVRTPSFPVHRREIPHSAFEDGEAVRIEVRHGGRVRVVAWAETGDGPCSGCRFLVRGPGVSPPPLVTDASGRALSEPVAPGRYSVAKVEVASTPTVVTVSSGGDTRWAQVEAGETATVEFGEPARRLTIVLDPPLPVRWELRARGPGWWRQPRAEGPGRYELRRTSEERVELSLRGPGDESLQVAVIPAGFEGEVFEVPLPLGRIHGRLMREDGPAGGVEVSLVDAATGAPRGTVTSNHQGRFSAPFLSPGIYHLLVDGEVVRTVAVPERAEVEVGEIPARS